ncbi:MAG: S-methyl-5'-thioadenosine phosphorylase [Actinomycetia bacterium]|nr:S-methyl-5'-thioadenosine phosphorylase [Actinomycetes bacterium]
MIGVIGGTGLYDFIEEPESLTVETPYGPPSDVITRGIVGSTEVVFLPRHGREHQWPPHNIPYRANMWALRSLGVTQVLAPCAVGSLQPTLAPGSFVAPDQLVDRTYGRKQTYVDSGMAHVSFTHPYCDDLRAAVVTAGMGLDIPITDGGTMVVIEGPRFGTRAESQSYAALGWSLVNMTGHPEAVLAREQELCYAPIALVTDMDAGVAGGPVVTQTEAVRIFRENTERMRQLVQSSVAQLPSVRTCSCATALAGMTVSHLPPT